MTSNDILFKALSDPARLRILDFLRKPGSDCCTFEGKVCACDIERELGLSQATISHHMKILVAAELVAATKLGRWMHYTIRPETFAATAAWFAERAAGTAPAPRPKGSVAA
ncbi:MAG: winged helix-turn-helix domain-containing protein [Alphaproteobacteria bacterium]|nr:winged helix-turn-helix domain-containing protein [Alphaproteobacteria bacterium]